MDSPIFIVFQLVVLIFSVIIHEISHGFMALRLGDETAKDAGRLTLNPISHLDPVGSIILPLLMFMVGSPILLGWAKPVPYNPLNLYKDRKYGPLKVAIAGPLSNLLIALIFGLFIRFGFDLISTQTVALLSIIVLLNCVLFIFNMLPVPPLDGSKILTTFLPFKYAIRFERMGLNGMIIILLFLALFPGLISGLAYGLFTLIVG